MNLSDSLQLITCVSAWATNVLLIGAIVGGLYWLRKADSR